MQSLKNEQTLEQFFEPLYILNLYLYSSPIHIGRFLRLQEPIKLHTRNLCSSLVLQSHPITSQYIIFCLSALHHLDFCRPHHQVSDPRNRGCQSCRAFHEGIPIISNVGSGARIKVPVGFGFAEHFSSGHVCQIV